MKTKNVDEVLVEKIVREPLMKTPDDSTHMEMCGYNVEVNGEKLPFDIREVEIEYEKLGGEWRDWSGRIIYGPVRHPVVKIVLRPKTLEIRNKEKDDEK